MNRTPIFLDFYQVAEALKFLEAMFGGRYAVLEARREARALEKQVILETTAVMLGGELKVTLTFDERPKEKR